jgi:hypothetical protein
MAPLDGLSDAQPTLIVEGVEELLQALRAA